MSTPYLSHATTVATEEKLPVKRENKELVFG
jgi:hypothetical protein